VGDRRARDWQDPIMETAFVYGPHLQAYNPSDDAERPLRRRLGIDLIGAYGLLDRDDVTVVEPEPATEQDLVRVHAPAYVAAVRRYSADPSLAAAWEAGQWGLAPGGDTPARAGMHEAALGVCGAALTAADLVLREDSRQVYCPAPVGLHHALANRASGFCVYNDCALAIRALLDGGLERVAYVDVDAHHGDGVQWLFYDDPRVLTVSVHESGRYLFPGTGGMEERGTGDGIGTAVNVPLPPFTGSRPFLRAVEEVVVPAVSRFAPDALLVHLGADIHHADPLAHLCVELDAFPRLYRLLHDLAGDAAADRYVVLAGGGYNIDFLARAWALQVDELVGVGLSDDLPADWLDRARHEAGQPFTERLMSDTPVAVPAEQRERADADADRVVDEARALFAG
jgi:acetoin utilization protein AcuC